MLMLALLLVPLVLAAEEEKVINNYLVKIKDDTLTKVQLTEKSSGALDLSGLGLKNLDKDVLHNLVTLRNLSLANNSLSSIPNGLFSRLASLEHLCLASNNLSSFRDAFAGLMYLKTLNISYNPVKKLQDGEFFGLPKSIVVFTKGLSLSAIDAGVFEEASNDPDDLMDADYDDETQPKRPKDTKRKQQSTNMIKICIEDNVLKSVEPLRTNESLPSGCHQGRHTKFLSLDNLGIRKFQKNWYQLTSPSIYVLSLKDNEISELTTQMLNDLPAQFSHVDLQGNRIERFVKGTIDHAKIRVLHLSSNRISEIEDGALARTGLWALHLDDNLIEDTRFLRTLPGTINVINLQRNKIAGITNDTFSSLVPLMFVYLGGNRIQELRSDSLRGLPKLLELELSGNRISGIGSGCFQRTPNLRSLDLHNNSIAAFERGTFDDLRVLESLDVSHNRLANIEDIFPNGLPGNLVTLKCDFNEIGRVKRGTFKGVTLDLLSLDGNGISRIEQGAFELPGLRTLSLKNNGLKEIDGDSFQGVDNLEQLSLAGNGITEIPRAFTRNLGNLRALKLGRNPIKRLGRGALPRLRKSESLLVHLRRVPLEVIEGGLFDYV